MANTHNPHGEANLNPDNYAFRFYFDPNPEWLKFLPPEAISAYRDEIKEYRSRLREKSTSIYGPTGRCAHCGAWIRYHVVFMDSRDDSLIAVGETCAEKRFEATPGEWREYKAKLDRMRDMARRGETRVKAREEFPEAVGILEDFLSERAEFFEILAERGRENDEREARGEDSIGNRDLWSEWSKKWPSFVKEIARNLQKWGNITERQADAVVRVHREYNERMEARARENENADPVPVTDDRITIEGTVLTTRGEDTMYGYTVKMLVKTDAGWKVWGTVPSALDFIDLPNGGQRALEKGDRVRFDAKVDPSNDDPKFGFFKRPTKAALIETSKP